MDAPAAQKPSRLTDALLYLSFFMLLTIAILISGGGRWIINQRAMQPTAIASSTPVDEDCSPCVAAARERERLAAQALLDQQQNQQQDDD